jgi:beta-N-acetylhexosaminidase
MEFGNKELAKSIGQMLVVGFDGLTPNNEIRTLITKYHVGHVVLFVRNIHDSRQLLELTKSLQKIARGAGHKHPLFISVDQENGLVSRVGPPIAPQFPGAMTLGATQSVEPAYTTALATAEYLRFNGIQYNLAPVADINSNPKNPVVGVRSYGDNPVMVGDFIASSARGLKDGKVVSCLKHFPGHGDTAVDSHHGTAIVPKTRSELDSCELVPFKRGIAEDIDSIMMAYVIRSPLGDELPASISAAAS